MEAIAAVLITLGTVAGMEFVAWLAHKYIMHGWLWRWHADHHNPAMKEGRFFEKNDLFFLVFALPSMAGYILSTLPGLGFLLWIAIGITIYGGIYFLIHDVYIHQRFSWFRQLESKYSKAILRAHGAHHARQTKEDCESFGLLVVNPKFFKPRRQSN
ncbi:MAG: sterol desaturase family protein [Saprospiraceae bacterium]|nr:sterol desaturase family protein [Saprospiraceae bacterium]